MGTPLSGGRDAIRRWMESPKTQRWVLTGVMQGLCQRIHQRFAPDAMPRVMRKAVRAGPEWCSAASPAHPLRAQGATGLCMPARGVRVEGRRFGPALPPGVAFTKNRGSVARWHRPPVQRNFNSIFQQYPCSTESQGADGIRPLPSACPRTARPSVRSRNPTTRSPTGTSPPARRALRTAHPGPRRNRLLPWRPGG